MSTIYESTLTGAELDAAAALAETAVQPGSDSEQPAIRISVVSALPETPDASTLYIVVGGS